MKTPLVDQHVASRNYWVDILRGIAILAVMFLHFHLAYHLDKSALNKVFTVDFLKSVFSNGNYGVTVFFVISGFLITSTSYHRYGNLANINTTAFYIFRFARIIPCLILMLSVVVILDNFHLQIFQNNPGSPSMFLSVVSVLTFWHNVLMSKAGYFNYCLNILWSLSVEEVFYFTFPLACLLFKKKQYIILFWAMMVILGPVYRSHHAQDEIVALYGYLSCFDAIAIGCITAIISQNIKLSNNSAKYIFPCSIILMISVYLYNGIMENIIAGPSLMALSAAMFLISAKYISCDNFKKKNSVNVLSKTICWFGKHSYELYLFHVIILGLMRTALKTHGLNAYTKLIWMAVFFFLSVLTAQFISKYYSEPMNEKIRKLLLSLSAPKNTLNEPAL